MPLIQVHLNTNAPDNLSEFQNTLSEVVATGVDKSENYVMTRVAANQAISFGRSTEPAAYVEVKNIGTLTPTQTGELSGKICKAIEACTAVKSDRIYIEFADAQRHLWGWNGRTFAT